MSLIMVVTAGVELRRDSRAKRRNDKALETIHPVIDRELNDSTAFVYHYNDIRQDLPEWSLIYPKAGHYLKKAVHLDDKQILALIPHTNVDSYSELAKKYKYLLYPKYEYCPFMDGDKDSIELVKYYDVEMLHSNRNRILYKLKRKETSIIGLPSDSLSFHGYSKQ